MKAILASILATLALAACAPEAPKIAAAPPPAAPVCKPAPTELVMQDLEPGTGDTVRFRSAALVSYTGWLYDGCAKDLKGAQFDTSVGRPTPFGFIVGAGRVIRGWDEGVIGMKENGKRLLVIPSGMAYGANGSPPRIPPNATLVFEVTVAKIVSQPSQ